MIEDCAELGMQLRDALVLAPPPALHDDDNPLDAREVRVIDFADVRFVKI